MLIILIQQNFVTTLKTEKKQIKQHNIFLNNV